MGKKQVVTKETHRHRILNNYGKIECFGKVHPKNEQHDKVSTQAAHDFSVELDAIGLCAMKDKIFNLGKKD